MSVSRRDFIRIGGLTVASTGFVSRALAQSQSPELTQMRELAGKVDPLTQQDYDNRMEKARRLMRESGVDGLFLSGSTNLSYFTKVQWGRSERTFGAILNTKGDPVWICPAFEKERALERIPKGHEVRTWDEHESPFALMSSAMRDLGAARGRLALGPTVRHFVFEGLRADAPGIEVVNGAPVTEGCRGVKTEKELGYMDLANRILKISYREAFRELTDGMSTGDLSSATRRYCSRMGVSGGGGPQFGPNSAFPHGSSVARDLQEGDIVLIDGGCGIGGFRSDVTRTVVFGEPTDRQRRVWDIVKKAQDTAHRAIRPGVTCEAVDAAARKVIEDAGFGPGYTYFSHRLGHGIGMEGHEYPYLVKGNTLKLQPGMTFSNEPGIYIYGEFGVRIEDCFAVTEDGARFLGGMLSTSIDNPFGG